MGKNKIVEGTGGPVRRFLHADHQGSIIAVADDYGNPIAINGYDAWGIPNVANGGRFQYTGQAYFGELGMYYYKARFYSPTLGRFLQTDPVGYKDQINLYAYVGNDPVDGRDPSGMESCPRSPCPDIPKAPPSVEARAVAALNHTSISPGTHESPIQVMVQKNDPSAVAEVRTGSAAGHPDPENNMRAVMNRIEPTDRYALGADAHQHPVQTRSDERDLAQRSAQAAADHRNLWPSAGDYHHMNQTNAPMFNKNTAGAITETFRINSVDHTIVIVPGRQPLGPMPSDLHDVVPN